jgi:hypothetical protein
MAWEGEVLKCSCRGGEVRVLYFTDQIFNAAAE